MNLFYSQGKQQRDTLNALLSCPTVRGAEHCVGRQRDRLLVIVCCVADVGSVTKTLGA